MLRFSVIKIRDNMKKRTILSFIIAIGGTVGAVYALRNQSILLLISIFILSFLIAYKLTDYIADFKTVKHQSRIDIAFLLIFCILLCIPASNISKAKKSKAENRYLAKRAVFVKDSKINLNFGKEFNEWFNDRFYLRRYLINANSTLTCMINSRSCQIGDITYNKKYNLVYRNYNFWGMNDLGRNKAKKIEIIKENLNKISKICKDRSIKLYILIVPRQCDYFEIDDNRKNIQNPADEVVDYLINNTGLKILYPKKEMTKANKETPVFFKTDHHWTKKGAYVGYNVIVNEIQKDFPDVPLLAEKDMTTYYDKRVREWWDQIFNEGQSYKHSGLPKFYAKKVLDTPYLYYNNPLKKDLVILDSEYKQYKHDEAFYYKNGSRKKLLVIGDSFGCNLFEFMPYSFENSIYLYNNPRKFDFEKYYSVLDGYKPDILVLLFYTPNIPKFIQLFPNEYNLEENL